MGISLFFKRYRLQSLSRYLKIRRLTVGYSTISERDVEVQSTLVISKSKGPCETLRDIRTSTYQIRRIEENTNPTTKFHK